MPDQIRQELDKFLDKIDFMKDDLKKEIHTISLNVQQQTSALNNFVDMQNLKMMVLNQDVSDIKKKAVSNELRLNEYDVKLSKVLGVWLAITTAITMFGRDVWAYIRGH